MTITNDTELLAAVSEAGALLQQIQDYCGRDLKESAKVRFPRGYLRTAAGHRGQLSFVENTDLKSNLAYCLILSESINWLLKRTDIAATAKEMLIKLEIFLCGSLVESITKDYLKDIRTPKKTYKFRTQSLVDLGIISGDLKKELDWVWDERNKMHLFILEKREYENDYNTVSLNRVAEAINELAKILKDKGRI